MRLMGGHASFQTDSSRLSDRLTPPPPPPHPTHTQNKRIIFISTEPTNTPRKHINLLMAAVSKHVCVIITGQGLIC